MLSHLGMKAEPGQPLQTHPAPLGHDLIHDAEHVLDMVSDLMGDDIGRSEIPHFLVLFAEGLDGRCGGARPVRLEGLHDLVRIAAEKKVESNDYQTAQSSSDSDSFSTDAPPVLDIIALASSLPSHVFPPFSLKVILPIGRGGALCLKKGHRANVGR
jgi:hypothetical protein